MDPSSAQPTTDYRLLTTAQGNMQTIWQDVRFGLRGMKRKPGFSVIAVLTLSLGMGATTAIFSVINGLLLRPLPYRDETRLFTLGQSNQKTGATREGVSPANFLDWREQAHSFEAIAGAEQWGFTLTEEGEPEAMRGWVVTPGFFEILGSPPVLGRTLQREDYEPGNEQVVVLSHGLWQRRFGGDAQVAGRQIRLNNQTFTIVGVMPPEFAYPHPPDRELWAPRPGRPGDPQQRLGNLFRVIARVKAGVSIEQSQQEMSAIAEQLGRQYPQTNDGIGAVVTPLREHLVGHLRLALYILFAAVALVLLIACANVAGLLLVRAAERRREFAMRAALGAARGRLQRQLMIESLLLSLPGGMGGLLLSKWLIDVIVTLSPASLPLRQIELNLPVLAFALGVSVLTAMIFGLAPAWQATRIDLQTVLKDGGRTESGSGRQRLRQALVVAEMALAIVVLIGAGLLVRSFVTLQQADPGFRAQSGLALEIQLGRRSPAERIVYFDQVLENVASLPGVEAVAMSSALPFHDNQVALQTAVQMIEPAAPMGSRESTAYMIRVSEGYFRALSIPLREGRLFTPADRGDLAPVTLVNATMAARLWQADTALGKKISFVASGQNLTAEVIGVVGDVRPRGFDSDTRPEFYLHYPQSPAPLATLFVRTEKDPAAVLPAVKERIRQTYRDEAFLSVNTIDQLIDKTTAQRRFNLLWLSVFALLALFLAAVGLYGLISFSTAQRTREIGVRLALGAHSSDVLKLIIREGLKLALTGVALGLLAAMTLTRLMKSLLFGVSSLDPLTFASIALLLTVVALLACYVPARRATKVDPMVALRYE